MRLNRRLHDSRKIGGFRSLIYETVTKKKKDRKGPLYKITLFLFPLRKTGRENIEGVSIVQNWYTLHLPSLHWLDPSSLPVGILPRFSGLWPGSHTSLTSERGPSSVIRTKIRGPRPTRVFPEYPPSSRPVVHHGLGTRHFLLSSS